MSVYVKDIVTLLEQWAPPAYQESYDNSGLLTGDAAMSVSGILVTLDAIEAVVDEAIAKNCNLIIAHHPIVFNGIKKLNGKNYVERTVIKAIKHDIAIYAIHTNLDNVHTGVNKKICDRLGLTQPKILVPAEGKLTKLVTYIPVAHLDRVQDALFNAGCGHIGEYSECSFQVAGKGTFRAGASSTPYIGKKEERHTESEVRLETIFPNHLKYTVLSALMENHPYEEVAYDLFAVQNSNPQVGSGMLGILPHPMEAVEFLKYLKTKMQTHTIRYTQYNGTIQKVAVCGGAGSFLTKAAITSGADAFVTADMKYHEFFDADNRLMIADIGHYESEIFTKELISDAILEKFPTFAVLLSEIQTNPIHYFNS